MQAKKVDGGFFLRLDKGEEVISSILNFVANEKIPSGVISGIGALTEVTLGYFDRKEKKYLRQIFNDTYELLSLNGNISYIGDGPIIHAHCVLGKADYQLIGGHLFSGIIAVTGEIYIQTFTEKFNRQLNDKFSLNLLDF